MAKGRSGETTGVQPTPDEGKDPQLGLSPRIDAAVSHFVRHPPAGSASTRPPRPPRTLRRGRRHDDGRKP